VQTVEIAPTAAALLKSLRGLGYTPETALADLIDNSIAAGASSIELSIDWNDGDPRIAIRDDGRGLSADQLEEAMRFAGAGPDVERSAEDLGRFGLGLKTAALSQCRRLTVISAQGETAHQLTWDVDVVMQTKNWTAVMDADVAPFEHVRVPSVRETGTLVALETMDEIGGLHGLDSERFYARLQDIRAHFGMVFHRFLSGDARSIRIAINGRDVEAWDPMLRTHAATRMLGSGRVGSGARAIHVTSFVLPHKDRFANEAEFVKAGGPGGWAERQGFYVYRGRRLVVAGSWLGLGDRREWTKDESSRLARIAIDLPTACDPAWRIDVRKARARPPASLRTRLVKVGQNCRERAREVFAWRGGQVRDPRQTRQASPMWQEEHVSGRRRYRVNRDHPLIQRLLDEGGETARLVRSTLSLIERSVPVERIWLDVSEDIEQNPESAESSASLISDIVTATRASRSAEPIEHIVDGLMRTMRVQGTELRSAILAAVGDDE
jgi:hypothetical protein